MDIAAIQKILSDAIKEYELAGNTTSEVLVTLISADIYRKLNVKAHAPSPKATPRQNKIVIGQQLSLEP